MDVRYFIIWVGRTHSVVSNTYVKRCADAPYYVPIAVVLPVLHSTINSGRNSIRLFAVLVSGISSKYVSIAGAYV